MKWKQTIYFQNQNEVVIIIPSSPTICYLVGHSQYVVKIRAFQYVNQWRGSFCTDNHCHCKNVFNKPLKSLGCLSLSLMLLPKLRCHRIAMKFSNFYIFIEIGILLPCLKWWDDIEVVVLSQVFPFQSRVGPQKLQLHLDSPLKLRFLVNCLF